MYIIYVALIRCLCVLDFSKVSRWDAELTGLVVNVETLFLYEIAVILSSCALEVFKIPRSQ